MRRLGQLKRRDEQGAVIVIVLLLTLSIFAMAALVIDVGALQQERRELQNSADAAALWLAQRCAAGDTAKCTTNPGTSGATEVANANATDGTSNVDLISFGTQRVTVTVSTRTASGGTQLLYKFAQLSGSKGKTVHANATATWAGLKRASVIPLVVSRCEFKLATQDGLAYDVPWTIYFRRSQPADTRSCSGIGTSGTDLQGGFGWVQDKDGVDDCNVTLTAAQTAAEDTGVPGTPHACNLSALLGKDVLVPIYDSSSGPNGAEYHVFGFGEFKLTGYYFSNSNKGGTVPCGSPNTCIGGRFVRFVAVGEYGGPNVGNQITLVS